MTYVVWYLWKLLVIRIILEYDINNYIFFFTLDSAIVAMDTFSDQLFFSAFHTKVCPYIENLLKISENKGICKAGPFHKS